MKKLCNIFLTLLTCFGFIIGLCGCDLFGGNSSNTDGDDSKQSSGSSSSGSSSSGSSSSGSGQTPGTSEKEPPQKPEIVIPTQEFTVTVRTESAKITDSGRASQKMDILLLSNYFDVDEAYRAGYTKLNITFTFEVKEDDDGYQYVFLYADKNCKGNTLFDKVVDEVYDPEDPSLLYEHRLEHGGSKKDTSWGPHSFSTTIKMDRLTDDLYIRYGASGKYDDDWQNRNVVVTFQVAK